MACGNQSRTRQAGIGGLHRNTWSWHRRSVTRLCTDRMGFLQWAPYAPLRDSRSRVKMNHKATMELLRQMVAVVAENLRSRRIHLGLDEPFGVDSTPEGQR